MRVRYLYQFCCIFKKDAFHNVDALYERVRLTGSNIIYLNIVLNIKIEFIAYLTVKVVAYIT